jgi:hypothetical protein
MRKDERREREPDVGPLEELVRIVGEADRAALQADKRASHSFEPPLRKTSGRFFEAVAMRWRFGAGAEDRSVVAPMFNILKSLVPPPRLERWTSRTTI